MRRILCIWARARRFRRRLYGSETPHWATDTYKRCKFLNVLELLPTLFAVFSAPDHFFRRRGLITRKRSFGVKTVYRSPVGFVGRIVTLLIGYSWFSAFNVQISQFTIAGYLIAIFATLPLVIP